jgi:transposase
MKINKAKRKRKRRKHEKLNGAWHGMASAALAKREEKPKGVGDNWQQRSGENGREMAKSNAGGSYRNENGGGKA